MRGALALAAVFVCLAAAACMPVHPSARQLVGRWHVDWECGTEVLELREDGTYQQWLEPRGGARAQNSGQWTIRPATEFQERRIVLERALEFCDVNARPQPAGVREDRALYPQWEWGRTVLEFNPDLAGYERERD